ncbi:MAG: enolase [Chloroflexi bacterium]|nr:enolase [Chloroflexota bacterium]
MRITDVEVIEYQTTTRHRGTRWGYGVKVNEEIPAVVTLTRIATDEGVEGYMPGGTKAIERVVKPMLVGEDPLDRERLWHWMDQLVTFSGQLSERDMGIVDCALWDLAGRTAGLPVSKLLGGARDRVRAYASTAPNLGDPDIYAAHALACKAQGYTAYKVHANICWNPHTRQPAPQLPGFPKEDVEICRAVREAVGDDMVLMLDPFGVYTLEESLWVGRELEKLNFYWLEHPMIETRVEAYRRLTRGLDIAICSPEHVPGGVFSRAEWALQGAADMLRIDIYYGGITGCWKLINLCQALGLQCEMHTGGWANAQLLAATTAATCEYYEWGLLEPGVDYPWLLDTPCLMTNPEPPDANGDVPMPTGPGLGFEVNWDFLAEHRLPR